MNANITRLLLFKNHYVLTSRSHLTRTISYSTNDVMESLSKFDETIRQCRPSQTCQDLLCQINEISCTSWSSSILIYSLATRIIFLLPLSYYQESLRQKMIKVLKPEIEKLGLRKKQELESDIKGILYKTPDLLRDLRSKRMKEFNQERSKLYIKLNLHPTKPVILSIAQMPYWLFSSAAIRNLSYNYGGKDFIELFHYNQLRGSSFIWLNDLTMPDPYLALPLVFATSSLLALQIYKLGLPANRPLIQRLSFMALQAITVCVTLRIAISPSALSLFLASGTFLHTIQLAILRRHELLPPLRSATQKLKNLKSK